MSKKIKTIFNLSIPELTEIIENDLKDCSTDITIDLDPSTNTISVEYKGKEFQTICEHGGIYDDTIIIEPKIHYKLTYNELSLLGTFFLINDMNCNQIGDSGSAPTTDFIRWLIDFEGVYANFLIDPRKIKASFLSDRARLQKTIEYLKDDNSIKIIDNKVINADELTGQLQEMIDLKSANSNNSTQFNYINIVVSLGFPSNINDLIEYVNDFRDSVYNDVK